MRPWSTAPVVQLITLPGAPAPCQMCGRAVRVAIQTPTGRYCPCGACIQPQTAA